MKAITLRVAYQISEEVWAHTNQPTTPHFTELPCAAAPWKSYRYRGRYGWIMIGAVNDIDALAQALLSVGLNEADTLTRANLERWDENLLAYRGVLDMPLAA